MFLYVIFVLQFMFQNNEKVLMGYINSISLYFTENNQIRITEHNPQCTSINSYNVYCSWKDKSFHLKRMRFITQSSWGVEEGWDVEYEVMLQNGAFPWGRAAKSRDRWGGRERCGVDGKLFLSTPLTCRHGYKCFWEAAYWDIMRIGHASTHWE